MRISTVLSIVTAGAAVLAASPFALAQETKASLEQKLKAQYPLTKLSADRKEVVTAGSVFTLKVDNLVLTPNDASDVSGNSYKAGKIMQSATGKTNEKAKKIGGFLGHIPVPVPGSGAAGTATGTANATRTFVAGEKLNITKIEVKDAAVVFEVCSAKAYTDQNVYYHASLTFPIDKGTVPAADAMLATTGEVFSVDPPDTKDASAAAQPAAGGTAASAPAAAPAPPPPPVQAAPPEPQPKYADIPPPPPPPDTPAAPAPALKLGLTVDQVVAQLGQPINTVVAGNKQIYLFKEWKVTFEKGKVTDIDVR
jgi:hypothetical protein